MSSVMGFALKLHAVLPQHGRGGADLLLSGKEWGLEVGGASSTMRLNLSRTAGQIRLQ
tara:strand:+ start:2167 stop:2340 length:174 start_codon:yes stop_codon:yes gene_type:complete